MENKAKAGIIEILDNNSKIIGYIAINLNTADLDDDKMSVARRLLNKCSRLYNDMIDENKV